MLNKWYVFFKIILGPPVFLWNMPTIEGKKNIPRKGSVILASNHQAVMDSFFLPLMVWRQLTFPAKKEYFTSPGLSGAIQRFFFSSVGQIPVDRNDSGASDSIQEAAEKVFEQGKIFGYYPEGTRSPDGRLYKGHTGLARLAMKSGKDVIPVAMIGSRNANPIGTVIPRPAWVHIKIGEPINPHKWAREHGYDPNSRDVMRPFTDYVMHTLSDLSKYPYVDVYASEVKKSLEQGLGYPEGTEPDPM